MKAFLRNFGLLWIGFFILIFVQPQPVVGANVQGNVAKLKLTPPLEWGYTLGGYGARMSRPAEGIHDDIWVKALVLHQENKKMAVVTMDILGLPPNVKPQVVNALNDPTWLEENIILLPSHSHKHTSSLTAESFLTACL